MLPTTSPLALRTPLLPRPRLWFLATAAVLAGAAVLFLARLGDRGVVSEELRWAEVAREMRLTGDYLHPTIDGRTYYDKPLGSYWLIVAASHLTGGVDETAARLPAAVAGWVGVLLVMLLGRRLYDEPTAVLAGAALATAFGFAFYARRATADVETITGVLAAVWLYARHHDRPAGPWVVGLWLVMAATSLTKGLLGFALPVVVLGTHGTWAGLADMGGERWTVRWAMAAVVGGNRWLFNRWTLLAVPLGGVVYLMPFVLSVWETGAADGLAMVWRENVRRFFAPHNHTGPVYLYAGVVFVLAAPWSAFLPAALVPPRRPGSDGDRLARAFFWAVFVFFTLSASRRSYYLLPVLPAVSLLVARVLTTPAGELRPVARWLRAAGYAIAAGGVVLAGVALLPPADVLPAPYDRLPPLPDRWALGLGWLAGLAAAGWAVARPRWHAAAVAAVAAAGVGYVLLDALPAAEGYRTRRAFAAEVRERVAAEPGRLALFHARDVVFDLGYPAPVPEYETAEELAAAVRAGRVRWVIARKRYLAAVHLPAVPVAEEPGFPWDGPDQAGDKMVLLEVISQAEPQPTAP